jgi:hypothetical protein
MKVLATVIASMSLITIPFEVGAKTHKHHVLRYTRSASPPVVHQPGYPSTRSSRDSTRVPFGSGTWWEQQQRERGGTSGGGSM